MDLIKLGKFLKELRNEKELTQEQFSEIFNVSRKSVSRWETGRNLPDIDILIEISEYFSIELIELLNGERKSNMNDNLKETVLKVTDYNNEESKKYIKRLNIMFIIGFLSIIISTFEIGNSFIYGIIKGIPIGMMIVGIIITSKHANKIRAFKKKLLHIK